VRNIQIKFFIPAPLPRLPGSTLQNDLRCIPLRPS
jgi:hypothetical protein